MDSGPVDAGPNLDEQYDDPTQPPSPEQDRKGASRQGYFRSASTRRNSAPEGQYPNDGASSHGSYSSKVRRRQMSETSLSSFDPPTYYQVGATADEITGEALTDGDGQIKGSVEKKGSDGSESKLERHRIYKFTLYETNARYWIAGADFTEKQWSLLRIDRTSPPGQITLFEDDMLYDRRQLNEALTSIDEGNKATGGLRRKYDFWGLLGFIRFTESYYMLIITKRKQVAMIGGHYVYQIEGTELVPLTTGPSSLFAQNRNPEETRFLGILNNLDLTKSFYFSYSYDISQSLQHNIIAQRKAVNQGWYCANHEFNSMFVWNHHLLQPAVTALKHPFNWCLPIIHGFIDQAPLDIFGRAVYITIIGRRSRFFAGARFLKRGVNDQGYVANDVETEQVVSEKLTTSFHAPGSRLYSNPSYTSYIHHRGSIPLYWTQDNSGVTPKPAIDLHLQDPFYQHAALHFDNLFERYGAPVYVLNLIKARERIPRESKLLVEFQKCIEYLNQSLPEDKKILYKAFDMSRESKTRGGDVIGSLEVIAKDIVEKTGFFRNGDTGFDEPRVQNGVARINCIDCLDRTNAAQFVVGKRAFALQLQALGVIDRDEVDFDTDAINIFTHMFHHHGDTIAVQYGGSHLVNTMATYRKQNQWQTQSRDMVESFKRYYHNSFLDNQRQDAYNLFLGNYVWAQGKPMLWDLTTDYYLHHSDPRAWLQRRRRSYNQWFTPEFLEPRELPAKIVQEPKAKGDANQVSSYDDYWLECYRPTLLSSLGKLYSYKMNTSNRYLPERPHRDSKFDYSPFKIRLDPQRHSSETPEKKTQRNRVKILDPQEESRVNSPRPPTESSQRPMTGTEEKQGILRESTATDTNGSVAVGEKPIEPADKTQMHLWTLNQFHKQSLHPYVSEKEALEYERYVAHPLSLPLVVSNELPSDADMDYIEYIHRGGGGELDDLDLEDAVKPALSERDMQLFSDFVNDGGMEDALTVTSDDGAKKRYKAYRQWLRGKSLFKQSKAEAEYKAGT